MLPPISLRPVASALLRRGPVAQKVAQPAVNVLAMARSHNIRLSQTECALIEKHADALGNNDGSVSEAEWDALVQTRAQRRAEKALLLEYIGRITETGTDAGQQALRQIGMLGIIFASITATYDAGDAGFHVMGATLVGCVTGVGGGTLNAAMMGATPAGWMVQPTPLIASLLAGVLTFYGLPLALHAYDEWTASSDTREAPVNDAPTPKAPSPSNVNNVSYVRGAMFAMESVSLASFSVFGAQSGITRGLPPIVCTSLGVSITFGGVFRDVLIQRDIALGARNQSYATSPGAHHPVGPHRAMLTQPRLRYMAGTASRPRRARRRTWRCASCTCATRASGSRAGCR